jgi:hypothetical protein
MITLRTLSRNYWPILVLFLSTFLVVWPTLTPGYFSHHDDLQVMRVFEMRKCFDDFQIPCRWVPDMGYGNGYPLFNYYGVFPYYIGGLLTYIFGFVGAAKALFFLVLFVGVFGMYFLASELFGTEVGFLAAILFEFAPYRALDSYVRGDIGESLAISLFPYLFFFSLKLIKSKSIFYFAAFTITLAIFLTTHNIMIMLFTPILIIWIVFWLLKLKQRHSWQLGLSFLISLGLAAFFLGPAFLEKSLVQTTNLIIGDLNFRAHFVTVGQLFLDRFWGYGASVPGDNDTISFQIGWPLWPLVLVSMIIVIFRSLQSRTKNFLYYLILGIFLFSIFMTHNKSAFVWEQIPLLSYVQFPWRFLAIIIFTGSILAVWWIQYLPKNIRILLVVILTGLVLVLNYSYFAPEKFYPDMTDNKKLSGVEWETQQKASIMDYLPMGSNKPAEEAQAQPFLINGAGQVSNFKNYTDHFSFDASATDQSLIEIPILDYPNWTTFVDGVRISHSNENYLKRMDLTLGVGSYKISGKLENTPIRIIANIVTIISIIFFIFILVNGQARKRFG